MEKTAKYRILLRFFPRFFLFQGKLTFFDQSFLSVEFSLMANMVYYVRLCHKKMLVRDFPIKLNVHCQNLTTEEYIASYYPFEKTANLPQNWLNLFVSLQKIITTMTSWPYCSWLLTRVIAAVFQDI